MKFLAKIAVKVCRHIFLEHCDQTEIVAVAVADAWIPGIVWVEALARRCDWIKSFGPYIPEWWTVV